MHNPVTGLKQPDLYGFQHLKNSDGSASACNFYRYLTPSRKLPMDVPSVVKIGKILHSTSHAKSQRLTQVRDKRPRRFARQQFQKRSGEKYPQLAFSVSGASGGNLNARVSESDAALTLKK
jgi:hypothetical protein